MGNDWLLICFAALILSGAGLTAALSIGEQKSLPVAAQTWAAGAALCLLCAGGACAVGHLGRPELIFGALAHPATGIFREFTTTVLTSAALLAYLIALVRRAEVGTTMLISRVAAVLAIVMAAAVGSAFYMPWRAGWNTLAIVLPFAGMCIALAAFAAECLEYATGEGSEKSRFLSMTGCAVALIGIVLYVLATVISDGVAPVLSRVLGGDLTGLFTASLVAGIVVPFGLCLTKPMRCAQALLGFLSMTAGAALFQWTLLCLGMPAWQFFAK